MDGRRHDGCLYGLAAVSQPPSSERSSVSLSSSIPFSLSFLLPSLALLLPQGQGPRERKRRETLAFIYFFRVLYVCRGFLPIRVRS